MYQIPDAPWIGNPDYGRKLTVRNFVTECESCSNDICEGDMTWEWGGEYFCSVECLIEYVKDDIRLMPDDMYEFDENLFYTYDEVITYIKNVMNTMTAEGDVD